MFSSPGSAWGYLCCWIECFDGKWRDVLARVCCCWWWFSADRGPQWTRSHSHSITRKKTFYEEIVHFQSVTRKKTLCKNMSVSTVMLHVRNVIHSNTRSPYEMSISTTFNVYVSEMSIYIEIQTRKANLQKIKRYNNHFHNITCNKRSFPQHYM